MSRTAEFLGHHIAPQTATSASFTLSKITEAATRVYPLLRYSVSRQGFLIRFNLRSSDIVEMRADVPAVSLDRRTRPQREAYWVEFLDSNLGHRDFIVAQLRAILDSGLLFQTVEFVRSEDDWHEYDIEIQQMIQQIPRTKTVDSADTNMKSTMHIDDACSRSDETPLGVLMGPMGSRRNFRICLYMDDITCSNYKSFIMAHRPDNGCTGISGPEGIGSHM